jgi:hypothetical protein
MFSTVSCAASQFWVPGGVVCGIPKQTNYRTLKRFYRTRGISPKPTSNSPQQSRVLMLQDDKNTLTQDESLNKAELESDPKEPITNPNSKIQEEFNHMSLSMHRCEHAWFEITYPKKNRRYVFSCSPSLIFCY